MVQLKKQLDPQGPPAGYLQTHGHPPAVVSQVIRDLLIGKPTKDIVEETGVKQSTIYRWANNLVQYGAVRPPQVKPMGRPRRLTRADEEALFEWLSSVGPRFQKEMRLWLLHVRGVDVNQCTISRLLKRNNIASKDSPKAKQRKTSGTDAASANVQPSSPLQNNTTESSSTEPPRTEPRISTLQRSPPELSRPPRSASSCSNTDSSSAESSSTDTETQFQLPSWFSGPLLLRPIFKHTK